MINYRHSENTHCIQGPEVALPLIIGSRPIHSILDVGAGTGTWIRAAQLMNICSLGVDGVRLDPNYYVCDPSLIKTADFTQPFFMNERFDAVICFEVAEHLPDMCAKPFIQSIVRHADMVFFGAAIPNQYGQNHVNCQYPAYWQSIFNSCGYACYDDIRLKLWDNDIIEPWYKQNIFRACKSELAGNEPRIPSLIHPEMLPFLTVGDLPLGGPDKPLFKKLINFIRR